MRLTADEIAQLLPHSGRMCLLEGVLEWDAERICCVGRDHRDSRNPLRVGERFHATSAIEYAAQAMAAHGGLTGRTAGRPRAGYLVSLREITCQQIFLDDLEGELTVEAEHMLEDSGHALYRFTVRIGMVEAVTGRAMVILDGGTKRG
jgi:predicted hotdog family 3-hydroxylacyl-ACP dehydratase